VKENNPQDVVVALLIMHGSDEQAFKR